MMSNTHKTICTLSSAQGSKPAVMSPVRGRAEASSGPGGNGLRGVCSGLLALVTVETHRRLICRAAVVRWRVVGSGAGKQPGVLETEPEVRRSGSLCSLLSDSAGATRHSGAGGPGPRPGASDAESSSCAPGRALLLLWRCVH